MAPKAFIAGVGMTRFVTPNTGTPYTDLALAAVREALQDASLSYTHVQQVFAGYVYGDSASGQRAVYDVGLTGVPIFNINNNCATGSTALFLARQAVLGGAADCVLALGFEQMTRGPIAERYSDRPGPLERFVALADSRYGPSDAPLALRLFGRAARDYAARHGTRASTFATIAVKARKHAAANPRAVFRDSVSVKEILASPTMFEPLTRLQCCPPTCGAAAAVVVSDRFARRRGLRASVAILAQTLTTDTDASFQGDLIAATGYHLTADAARQTYEQAGVSPKEIAVIELHDCFTSNEVMTYEALGLVPEGEAEKLIRDGDNTYGGRHVINPSGGLLAKGHPLGATGLAQCYELVTQLRGGAAARQVEGARIGLQHNIGLGGACVVTLYGKH